MSSRADEIFEMIELGCTLQNVGDKFNLSRERIRQIYQKQKRIRNHPKYTKKNIKLKKYWIYIILCQNGTYYAGMTKSINRRMNEHFSGQRSSLYTKKYKPISVPFAMLNFSTRERTFEAETYIHKNYHILIGLVKKEKWAIEELKKVWLS